MGLTTECIVIDPARQPFGSERAETFLHRASAGGIERVRS
ncbi:DUF3400 domain-containing protein [Thiococcus pfennigii]|nr:hypothetical protein [Thiococcus pfennigii]MBK1732698.1 hypothetical protein [Thiococcus pfennigii]